MTIFETLRGRIIDIIVNARGADSSLGADAAQKSIPLGRFREAHDRAPLRDPSYSPSTFDRALSIEWLSDQDDNGGGLNNPLDGPQFFVARVAINHGILYGTGIKEFNVTVGAETKATNALQSRERGLADAQRIRRALACPDLLRGGTPLDPTPLACDREGTTTLEDLGGGRLLVTTVYLVQYELDGARGYDP